MIWKTEVERCSANVVLWSTTAMLSGAQRWCLGADTRVILWSTKMVLLEHKSDALEHVAGA